MVPWMISSESSSLAMILNQQRQKMQLIKFEDTIMRQIQLDFCRQKSVKSIIIGSLVLVLMGVTGCVPKTIDPMALPVQAIDAEQAEFPPTEDELVTTPNVMLPFVVNKDSTVTAERETEILNFIYKTFEKYGNFRVVDQKQVNAIVEADENRQFQVRNVADAIQLGIKYKADFVSQMLITITESKKEDNIDRFKANTNLTVFTTSSGQVVFKQDVQYDSSEPEKSEKNLKLMVQEYFKLRGFILETRGGHQVAKISLGRSLGIKLGREFEIRERKVSTEIVNGLTRKTISFSPDVLAKGKAIKIMENESWIQIPKEDQKKIKKGQMVFSLPEKTSLFQ